MTARRIECAASFDIHFFVDLDEDMGLVSDQTIADDLADHIGELLLTELREEGVADPAIDGTANVRTLTPA